MFEKSVKHRANDASNDGHRPPLLAAQIDPGQRQCQSQGPGQGSWGCQGVRGGQGGQFGCQGDDKNNGMNLESTLCEMLSAGSGEDLGEEEAEERKV